MEDYRDDSKEYEEYLKKSKVYDENIPCCANCRHLISYAKHNRYNDFEHLCVKTGYFCIEIFKDATKYKHLTPGGKELSCEYERR